MLNMQESWRPANTGNTMDNKVEEIFQYLDLVYPTDPYRAILDHEKVYRFMFFVVHREKKPRGGTKKQRVDKEFFDLEDYRRIVDGSFTGTGLNFPPAPANPCQRATFDMYKACIKKVHRVQVTRGVNNSLWEEIWTEPLDVLLDIVKTRTPHMKKLNYHEKVDAEFAPYLIVESYEAIESELWSDSSIAVGRRSICTKLRHRYCVAHTTSGVLRAESIYRAELSDFSWLDLPKKDTDVHPMGLMINQLAFGKTNHGRKLYGRATRHKDVRLCCVGALGFYLAYRFHCTGEMRNMSAEEWIDNRAWFDIKLLVDINGGDNTTSIKNDSFGKHVKGVLSRLGIACSKLLHLGRNLGSKTLELLEAESSDIQRMGQWNPGTFDNHYSTKLPIGPIRKLAGYHSNNKMYFNTRTSVLPSEELLKKGPFSFALAVLEEVLSAHNESGKHPTAVGVLKFSIRLNTVFIQDSAAMLILHEGRSEHPVLNELAIFESAAFEVSRCLKQLIFISLFSCCTNSVLHFARNLN